MVDFGQNRRLPWHIYDEMELGISNGERLINKQHTVIKNQLTGSNVIL